MNRKSQVLFGAASVPIAGVLCAIGGIPLVPPLAFGAFFLVLTIALLIWKRQAVSAYRGDGVVAYSRGSRAVIVGLILIEAVCALDLLFAPSGADRVWIALGYFLAGIAYLIFMPGVFLFWVADNTKLTSQLLSRKRSLPWQEIDWLYVENNETAIKQGAITVSRVTDEQLIAEAGPQRSIQVMTRTPYGRTNQSKMSPLLQAIRTRATNALVGVDKLPAVEARRRGQPSTLTPQPEPNVSLKDATDIARGPALPPSWTRFSVRQRVIVPNLIIYTLLAVFAVFSGAFIVASGTVIGLGMVPASLLNGPQKPLILIGEGVFCVAIAVWLFFAFSLRWLRTLRHPQDYFFLVTPRYVADVQGQKVAGVPLADVRGVHRNRGGMSGTQLVLDLRNGKKQVFEIGANYGQPRDLYAYVLAALTALRPAQPVAAFGPAMQSDAEM